MVSIDIHSSCFGLKNNQKPIEFEMKITLLLVALAIGLCSADQCVEIPPDMNGQQIQSTILYEDFLEQTFNSKAIIELYFIIIARLISICLQLICVYSTYVKILRFYRL